MHQFTLVVAYASLYDGPAISVCLIAQFTINILSACIFAYRFIVGIVKSCCVIVIDVFLCYNVVGIFSQRNVEGVSEYILFSTSHW